jgi:hypothetical protein
MRAIMEKRGGLSRGRIARTHSARVPMTLYTRSMSRRVFTSLVACAALAACTSAPADGVDTGTDAAADASVDAARDAGIDAARIDASVDASAAIDAAMDAAPATDAGLDTGNDSGTDTGTDVGMDAYARAPGAPTNVTAVAMPGCIVQLTWQAPADPGTSAITGYQIDSSPAGVSMSVSTLTYTTSALACGTSYVFDVRAVSSVGAGSPGSSPSVVAGDVPGPPTNVMASAPSGRVTVLWGAAAANGYPISGYTITLSPGGATQMVGASATSATFVRLAFGTMYTASVHATNALGNGPNASSNAVTFFCTTVTQPVITALDSCSVEYGTPPLSTPDGNVEARRDPRVTNVDLRGFVRFSLASIPSWATITGIQLALDAGTVSGGTSPTPTLQLLYSPNTTWTRSAIPTPADMGTNPLVVSAQYPAGATGWQYFDVNVGAHDWSTDLTAGALTLGIQNVNTNYSFNTYYGTDTGPPNTGPYVTITTCQ